MVQARQTRRAPRLKHRAMAHFPVGGQEQTGFVVNLSEVGLFIQTRHLLKVGGELTFFVTPGSGQRIELKGKIVYSRKGLPMAMSSDPGGIGISLVNPPEEYLELISQLKG